MPKTPTTTGKVGTASGSGAASGGGASGPTGIIPVAGATIPITRVVFNGPSAVEEPTEDRKPVLRDAFELCKLDMCPSKTKCLRHARAGFAPESAAPERYGAFAILPGERRCPNFIATSNVDRFSVVEEVQAPEITKEDTKWLFDLWAELNANVRPVLPVSGRSQFSASALNAIMKMADNYEKIMWMAAKEASRNEEKKP